MENSFKKKYLKYKNKYLIRQSLLKNNKTGDNLIGGEGEGDKKESLSRQKIVLTEEEQARVDAARDERILKNKFFKDNVLPAYNSYNSTSLNQIVFYLNMEFSWKINNIFKDDKEHEKQYPEIYLNTYYYYDKQTSEIIILGKFKNIINKSQIEFEQKTLPYLDSTDYYLFINKSDINFHQDKDFIYKTIV